MSLITFVRFLYHHYPKRIPILLLFLTISGLLESIGIGAVIPIMEFFFQDPTAQAQSPLSSLFYGLLTTCGIPIALPSLFGLIIVIFGIKSTLSFLQHVLLKSMCRFFHQTQSAHLMHYLLQAQWGFLSTQKRGSLTSVFSTEMQQFILAITYAVHCLTEGMLFLCYVGLACYVSLPLTLLMIALLGLSVLPLHMLQRRIKRLAKALSSQRAALFHTVNQCLTGLKFIKESGDIQENIKRFTHDLEKTTTLGFKSGVLSGILPSFFIFFSIISISALAYIALVLLHLPFASFFLVTVIFYRLYPKFQGLQLAYQEFNINAASAQTIDTALSTISQHPEHSGTRPFTSLTTGITLNNVKFTHHNATSPTLSSLALSFPKNTFTGIIGPSGSGKSTLIHLLTGLYTPSSGAIVIDGIPLEEYDLRSFRKGIAVVAQDTFMFNDTIHANLTWGLEGLCQEDIDTACRNTAILDTITQCPQGFNTILGEQGLRLSGGQKQRLALARALLRKPSILILDEATSALDAESEQVIQQQLHALKGQVTLIVISHRLATIKGADSIVVLDKGRCVEQGDWETLSKRDGLFELFRGLQGVG